MTRKLIQRQPNYIRIGSTHMWFNPTAQNYYQVNDNFTRADDVHVYLTKASVITNELQEFLSKFFKNGYNSPLVTIHIPRYIKDSETILEDFVFSDTFYVNPEDLLRFEVQYVLSEIKIRITLRKDIPVDYIPNYHGYIKHAVIQNFRRCCPKEKLERFNNDDEIWDYIVTEKNNKLEE